MNKIISISKKARKKLRLARYPALVMDVGLQENKYSLRVNVNRQGIWMFFWRFLRVSKGTTHRKLHISLSVLILNSQENW
jgi:hypothetical protein